MYCPDILVMRFAFDMLIISCHSHEKEYVRVVNDYYDVQAG